MRRKWITLCGLLLIILVLPFVALRPPQRIEQALPDGSIIRIEKVTFAKSEEQLSLGGPLAKFKRLIRFIRAKFSNAAASPAGMGAWSTEANIHTNEPALYVYISRRIPGKGYSSVDVQAAEIIDEDGCIFEPIQDGGEDDGSLPRLPLTSAPYIGNTRYSVGWFRFEAFPRHDNKFRFAVGIGRPLVISAPITNLTRAEFTVSNPVPPSQSASWAVEPLPITRKQGDVSFILTNVAIVADDSNGEPPGLAPKSLVTGYQFIENGSPSANWLAVAAEMRDSSGNYVAADDGSADPGSSVSPPPLCPRESAWKLRAKFFGDIRSRVASNTVWTLRGLAVPGPGKVTSLGVSNTLQGVLIKVGAFGGTGEFVYSNSVPLKTAPLAESVRNTSARVITIPNNWNGQNWLSVLTYQLQTFYPHLLLEVGDLGPDQRLTVRAVDERGREFFAHGANDGYSPSPDVRRDAINYLANLDDGLNCLLIFDIPADAKTVDLTFCIHTCRTAEFIFKPPPLPVPTAKNPAAR